MKKVLLLSAVFILLLLRFNTFAAENGSEGNTSISGNKSILAETEHNNVLIGDVNGDNDVNSIDLLYMKKYILGMVDTFPVETGFYCADVDGNNQIDAIDLAYMKKYLLGMIKDFPKSADSTDLITPTPTPTPTDINKPTPEPLTGFITYYYVNDINVRVKPGIEIFVEKSSKTPIKVSAATFCTGPLYADGWLKTYFRLGGNAVNGVDYEKIDFDYFWRPLGYAFNMNLGDDNPKEEFSIIPIDTGTDETKDLEIYFDFSSEPAAIIHFVKSIE